MDVAGLVVQGGALAALVFILVLLIRYTASGKIIPLATHERELAAANKRGDDYKAAFEKADARADEYQQLFQKLLTYAEATDKILKALPIPKERETAA